MTYTSLKHSFPYKFINFVVVIGFSFCVVANAMDDIKATGVETEKKTDQHSSSVVIDSYDWSGKIPVSRQVIVRNPYGSISSRTHGEEKVILHATMQQIGAYELKPEFIISEQSSQLVIEVTYPETIFDQTGSFKARTDVAILFPDFVNFYAETDFGMIKVDKSASTVSAFTQSGNIKLATTGLFYAESSSGVIDLKLRGLKMPGKAVAKNDTGAINVELFNDMELNISADSQGKLIKNGLEVKQKPWQYSLGSQLSKVRLMAGSGAININIVEPPALAPSVKPSKKNIDLRQLPIAKLWRPGEPIVDRDDRKDNRHNK